ncbi:MAG: GNAT family N-acetyltransferase [Acidobacteriota bacterium]|nr:GNAT family N-acetyltransferase [Acidobacteriota bacterium]MDQ5873331.1 GNAT family N-acetyltransferase [Acidobacteriota bacterium]
MPLEPVVFQGAHVRLEPLSHDHLEDLLEVALDEEIWRWTTERARSREELRAWIDRALAARDTGTAMPFATVALPHGKAIGGTRFATFSEADRRVEIGWTWIGRDWQRTAVNTEAKYLMLRQTGPRRSLRNRRPKTLKPEPASGSARRRKASCGSAP